MTHSLNKTERQPGRPSQKRKVALSLVQQQALGEDFAAQFGRRVFNLRTDLGLSQKTMIARLNDLTGADLGRSTASVWENGHSEPSISLIHALAQVLHTSPEYLAFGVGVRLKVSAFANPLPNRSFLPDPVSAKKAYDDEPQVYRRRQGA